MFFRMVYKSGQIFLPFCHNTRVWQTDRRTDGRTEFSSQYRVCITCSAVKIVKVMRGNISKHFLSNEYVRIAVAMPSSVVIVLIHLHVYQTCGGQNKIALAPGKWSTHFRSGGAALQPRQYQTSQRYIPHAFPRALTAYNWQEDGRAEFGCVAGSIQRRRICKRSFISYCTACFW